MKLTLPTLVISSLLHAAIPCAHAGKVELRVNGEVSVPDSATTKSCDFTLESLQSFPQQNVGATNKYVSGKSTFQGPLLRDVLSACDVHQSTQMELIFQAADGYVARAPLDDAFKFDVIVALSNNNAPLKAHEKGPLWVVYPLDAEPDGLVLQDAIDKMVWNLKKITVKLRKK